MRTTLKRLATMAALLALPVVACDDGEDPTGTAGGESEVTVLLTDAPGDFHAAVVTITEISLRAGEEDPPVLLSDEEMTVDLVTLANDVATVVDDAEVPEGDYTQLRIVISGGYIEVEQEDGGTIIYASSPDYEGLPEGAEVEGDLQMPSFEQSGLKVQLPSDIEFGGDVDVLLDFDVSQSFGRQAGQSGKWVMQPVIHAAEADAAASVEVTLELDDDVSLPEIGGELGTLADFDVALVNGDGGRETMSLADANADGVFEATFDFVVPEAGPYSVELVGPDGLTFTVDPASPVDIDVDAGATTSVDFELTAVD